VAELEASLELLRHTDKNIGASSLGRWAVALRGAALAGWPRHAPR
jgi:hypothetical protein